MRRLFWQCLTVAMVLFVAVSCSEEQDFDQFDDLSVTPTLASSIFYLESDEDFINQGSTLVPFYSQTFNFDAFNEQFVAERLLEGTITYEIENTTSKQLNVTIEFLDELGNVLDVETFDIDPAPAAQQTIEVDYGPGGKSLDILTNTSTLRVTGTNLGDSTSVSTLPEPVVVVRSAAEFIFRLE